MLQHYSSILPASAVPAFEAALENTFGATDITGITLLTGGLSAASVYQLEVGGQLYVLKLETPSAHTSSAAAAHLKLAADAGVAPPLLYQDTENGVSISRFIVNQPIRTVLTPDQLIQQLADRIKTIHAIPCHSPGNDLLKTIEQLIHQFQQAHMLSGAVFDECFRQFATIKASYPWYDGGKVFSHNDLNPGNTLCDGKKIWMIDWDVSSLNDRYVDLANVANFFVHTPAQEADFLNSYFGASASDYQKARFYVMRQVCRIIYAMLMFHLARQSKAADYQHSSDMEGITMQTFGALMGAGKISLSNYDGQLLFGKALINESVQQMRSARFETSLIQITCE